VLKKALRKKIIKLREKKYNPNIQIKLEKIIKIFKKKKLIKPLIGGYYPSNHEIDCVKVMNQLNAKGYKISLPLISNNSQMEFYTWNKFEPLMPNKYGIPEPTSSELVFPDVIIVPMVAFDKYKYRIGYGGGYYDRYLKKIYNKKKCLTIGFAFSFQKINKVPVSKHDRKLDMILTERSIF